MKNPKVGERVAVYGRSWGDAGAIGTMPRTVCHVLAVGLDMNLIRVGEDTGTTGWSALVHPKQCRRLVRVQRDRIWVWQQTDGTYDGAPRKEPPPATERPRVRNGGEWREFVAVRAKKA